MTSKTIFATSRMAVLAAAVSAATLLGACAPLLVGGAMVGTALSVTDRRTSGAQLEDQSIELKAINRVREAAGSDANVSVTSYNRTVLITGEVPTEAARVATEQAVARIENVRDAVIPALANAGMEATFPENVLGEPLSVRHFALHLYGHLNYHLGQVNYLRRILG